MNTELAEKTTLEYLQLFLSTTGLDCHYFPVADDKPYENLMVFLGPDHHQRELWARVYFLTDVQRSLGTKVPEELAVLEVTLPLSIQIPDNRKKKTAYLLSVFNRLLPGLVLLFNDLDGVYFRYPFVLMDCDDLWPFLLKQVLEMMQFFTRHLQDKIEAVAAGQLSVEEAITQAEKSLGSPP